MDAVRNYASSCGPDTAGGAAGPVLVVLVVLLVLLVVLLVVVLLALLVLLPERFRGCALSILAGRSAFGAARYEFWRGEALSGLRGVDSGASGRFRGCAVSIIHGRIVDSGRQSGAARRLRGRCAVSILARRRAFGAARYGFWRGGSLSAAKLRPLVFTCFTCLNTRNENVKTKRLLSFSATKATDRPFWISVPRGGDMRAHRS